jgi:GDPmannose 4,6-dehydratase
MLQQDNADDYIIATGNMMSVREFCQKSFARYGMNYEDYVEVDSKYYRPAEVDQLLGDPSKAKKKLGWNLEVDVNNLINMMTDHDFNLARKESIMKVCD